MKTCHSFYRERNVLFFQSQSLVRRSLPPSFHKTNDVILNARVFGALGPRVDSTTVGTAAWPVRRRRRTVTLSTVNGTMANATAFTSYVVVCFVWGCVCEIHWLLLYKINLLPPSFVGTLYLFPGKFVNFNLRSRWSLASAEDLLAGTVITRARALGRHKSQHVNVSAP